LSLFKTATERAKKWTPLEPVRGMQFQRTTKTEGVEKEYGKKFTWSYESKKKGSTGE